MKSLRRRIAGYEILHEEFWNGIREGRTDEHEWHLENIPHVDPVTGDFYVPLKPDLQPALDAACDWLLRLQKVYDPHDEEDSVKWIESYRRGETCS